MNAHQFNEVVDLANVLIREAITAVSDDREAFPDLTVIAYAFHEAEHMVWQEIERISDLEALDND